MFLSAWQAADYVGLKIEAIYELLESGEIEADKIDDRWRVRKTALDAWLDAEVTDEELEQLTSKLRYVNEEQARQILKDAQSE
jgi:excisionase family DNA binding protein